MFCAAPSMPHTRRRRRGQKTTAKERAQVLRRWFDLVIANADDLALILTSEQGKPLAEAKAEIVGNAAYLEWFGEEAKRIDGDIIPSPRGDQRTLVLKQPVGVCAAITPWNFPVGMITRKGRAGAGGWLHHGVEACATDAFVGAGAGDPGRAGWRAQRLFLRRHGRSQTPSARNSAQPQDRQDYVYRLDRGGRLADARGVGPRSSGCRWNWVGNAPFIVFDDADLDAAVAGAMASKYRNAGQTCISANRIYVQDSVHDAFVDKLKAKIATLKLGRGTEEGVQMGPLIDAKALAKMQDHLKDVLDQGGTLVAGGQAVGIGRHLLRAHHRDRRDPKHESGAGRKPLRRWRR